MSEHTNWRAGIPNLKRLGEDVKHHVAGASASAGALVANATAIIDLLDRALKAQQDAARHVAEANRRTERLADAMRRMIHAYGTDRWSSAVEHSMNLIGTMGAVHIAKDDSYRVAIDALKELVSERSWISLMEDGKLPPRGFHGRLNVVWCGDRERHPRDIARVIIRSVFNLDPDERDFENSVLGPEPQLDEGASGSLELATEPRRIDGA